MVIPFFAGPFDELRGSIATSTDGMKGKISLTLDYAAPGPGCSSGSGSIGSPPANQPPTQISKCRCGPVDAPSAADLADALARAHALALPRPDRSGAAGA